MRMLKSEGRQPYYLWTETVSKHQWVVNQENEIMPIFMNQVTDKLILVM